MKCGRIPDSAGGKLELKKGMPRRRRQKAHKKDESDKKDKEKEKGSE